jgi:arginine decarboxylase
MPGERMGAKDSPIIRMLLALEKFGKQFPGFEREVHGIEVDSEGNYWMRAVIEEDEPPSVQRHPTIAVPADAPSLPSRPVRRSTE